MAKPNYELAAERAAKRAGINPRIFKAMIRAESDFNPNAGSTAGARGIAQFMPGTAPSYGVNLDDGLVTDDLNGAAKYIKEMLGKTGGNYHQALSMYNAGPGRPNGYKEIPETIAYVKKIMGGYKNERLQDGSSTPSTPSAPSSVPSVKTTKVTTPGIDNSGARAAAALQFLRSKSKDPVYLAQQVQGLQDTPAVTKTTTTPTGTTGGTSTPTRQPTSALPKGTATFEGKTVAAWIAPILEMARRKGWTGTIHSGFRTYEKQKEIYDSGVRPAAKPGTSNHEMTAFPGGAIDVTQPEQLARILHGSPKYRGLLQYAGAKDPVHFSHPHDGSY